jgi:hypothetical protein
MKINLLLLALLASIVLKAQISKGTDFLGGDLQVSGSTYKSADPSNPATNKSTSLNFSPVMGWAIKENVVVGGRLTASFFKTSQDPQDIIHKGQNFGAGIWVRKYLPLGKAFYLFGDAGFNGQSIQRKQTQVQLPGYYFEENGFALSAVIYPGVAYQVKQRLFLEAALNNLLSLGYSRVNSKQQLPNSSITKGVSNSYHFSSSIGNGVPLQLGVRWIIPKK